MTAKEILDAHVPEAWHWNCLVNFIGQDELIEYLCEFIDNRGEGAQQDFEEFVKDNFSTEG